VSNRRNWTGWILGVGCVFVVAAGAAAAQTVFSSALVSSLSGTFNDALPILVLADVGRPPFAGPPDGKLDLITADQSGLVTVWFGNGEGKFPSSNVPGTRLNLLPKALTLGDFNGDQVPDLAITETSGNVVLLYGKGDGTFGGRCAGGSQAGLSCVADRNCPGSVCTVPTVVAGGRCSVHTATTCTAVDNCPVHETCKADPVALAAAHVNDDANLDLIIVNSNQSAGWVTVLLGDGQGGFSAGGSVDLGPGGSAIGVDHFNGDGNVDVTLIAVTIANSNASSVAILRGDGSGNLSRSQDDISEEPNGGEPVAMAVGDLNNDGRPDVVVANQGTDNIGVLLGQADGSLQVHGFADSGTTTSKPNGIALLYANGDDKLDVAVSNSLSSDVSVLLGDGTGNFGPPRAFVTDQDPLAVAAGDVDGDEIPDLVVLNRDNTTPDAAVLLGQGDGAFKGVEDVIVEPNPNAVIAGDTDNDGLADLISAHPTGKLQVRRALPDGGFALPVALQAAGDAFAIGGGDFNADGRFDIVALNKSTSNVSMFLGQKNGFQTTPLNYTVGAGGVALTVGDWDGNGRPDVAVARQGAIDILLSNPNGTLQTAVPVTLNANPVAMDWGDFNSDGHLDLALAFGGLKVAVALGNGNGTFQLGAPVQMSGATGDLSALTVADFDGDGLDDVAVLLPSPDNEVVVLYGNGHGAFATGSQLDLTHCFVGGVAWCSGGSSSALWALVARDLSGALLPNGDLVPDLVVPLHADTHAVLPFFNLGSVRQFSPQATVPVSRSQGATTIVGADFDGDGRYDVASANDWAAGSVSVLTNITATPVVRGDGNGDGKATAADLVAVARKLRDGAATRVEQVHRGSYQAWPGADANGDGLVTAQDAWALAHRLFPRI
jgi:hypothetical protein